MEVNFIALRIAASLSGSLQQAAKLGRIAGSILLLGLLTTKSVFAGPDMDQYDLVFGDEFDGTELDANKWVTGQLWGPYLRVNEEEQFYVDTLGMHKDFMHSPFQFTGSTLKIVATPVSNELQPPVRPEWSDEPGSIWRSVPNMEYRFAGPEEGEKEYSPDNVKYLSGLITSYNSFNYTYGYVQARMKLPVGKGLFPAFWANTVKYDGNVPEIDIMEFVTPPSNRVYQNYWYTDPDIDPRIKVPSVYEFAEGDVQGWHTYGMEWSSTEIIWYVDGTEVHRVDSSEHIIANQDLHLIANMAVGGVWPGSPDENTAFPAATEIDYIRAYKKRSQPPVASDDTIGPIDAGSSVTFAVTANDTAVDGEIIPTSVTIVSQPESGSAEVQANGQVTYTHDGSSSAESDSFTYTVLDNLGNVSNPATVSIAPIEAEPEAAEIIGPVPGTQLSGTDITFTWDDNGADIQAWIARVGSTPFGLDYANVAPTPRTDRSFSVSGLPTDGSRVYVSLVYWLVGGGYVFEQQEYDAYLSEEIEPTAPEIVDPVPGARLPGTDVTFTWDDNGSDMHFWFARVGSKPFGTEYANVNRTNKYERSFSVSGLPTDGSRVYVMFQYYPVGSDRSIIEHLEYDAVVAD